MNSKKYGNRHNWRQKLKYLQRQLSLLFMIFFLTGCTFDEEPSECPYNLLLEYWYAGSGKVNVLRNYIGTMQLYLFDSEGRLAYTRIQGKESVVSSALTLSPGDYTLVCWGNKDKRSSHDRLETGITRLQDLLLTSAPGGTSIGVGTNTEPLYFGYGTFTMPDYGTVRKRIYITHCHTVLRIYVRWQKEPPSIAGKYRMTLRTVPCDYRFVKGMEIPVPDQQGAYTFPVITSKVTDHEVKATMNYSHEVTGEFISYRFVNRTHPLFCLYDEAGPLMPEIDLWSFFRKLPVDMEHNVQQEFNLLITIGDKIKVEELGSSDWVEGGVIGQM